MTDPIHVFVYDPAPFEGVESEHVRHDLVTGTLFDVDGPVLMLSGHGRIRGEVRRMPSAALEVVDLATGVAEGLHRRVGVSVGDTPCWTWVAGPQLAQRLAAARAAVSESK